MKHLLLFLLMGFPWLTALSQPESYSWNSASTNAAGSMPCGGGDIGLNVWVEQGDLLFYISRTGTYDAQNTLLKQGRVRLRLHPNPFTEGSDFQQTLHLRDGYMTIAAGGTEIRLWVDVFKPVVHLEMHSKKALQAEFRYENWRYRDRALQKGESQQNSYKWAPPAGLVTKADSILPAGESLIFFHQNADSTIFDVAVNQQGLRDYRQQMYNPLSKLVSGGIIHCKPMRYQGTDTGSYAGTDFKAWIYKTERNTRKLEISIALHTEQTDDLKGWTERLQQTVLSVHKVCDRKNTQQWWNEFWQRSYIDIKGDAAHLSRNYSLFRYMLACNARGSDPTRFNGGLFTFDPVLVDSAQAFTPDYRKWGGGTFTAQNQRLVYWPLLKTGDADLMIPQFEFYRRLLPTAELRSQVYWGHGGACFAEQLENYGLPNPPEYGWKRPADFDAGVEYNAWLEYEWETVLEFCQMILETKSYAGANIDAYLPLIRSAVRFFDEHYRYRASQRGRREVDGNGRLIIYPGSACETYKMAYNPTSTVAALRRVLMTMGDPDSLLHSIPPISFREVDGRKLIAPAQLWERVNNTESPQLYPVFPWRFYAAHNDSNDIAKNTYLYDPDVLRFRSHIGWKQDNIWAACLGLTEEARRLTLLKLGDGPHRFPAFWGPGFDWTPDYNHGGSGMIGLQEMLMQTDDDGKIHLFPAWPREWEVRFKLHAPGPTVVEAEMKEGRIRVLSIEPERRRADLIIDQY